MAGAREPYNPPMAKDVPSPAGETPRGFRPGAPLRGSLRVPGSKSVAQRVLVAAGMCAGPTRLIGLPDGDDVRHAAGVLAGLGFSPEAPSPAGELEVRGRAPGPSSG